MQDRLSAQDLTEPVIAALRQQFRRCSPETLNEIIAFRRTHDLVLIEPIVSGIFRRYVPREKAEGSPAKSGAQLLQDSGLDSLTLLEALLDIQDALEITFNEDEVRGVQSFEGLVDLLRAKAACTGGTGT